MLVQKKFTRFAAICCLLSVITTLGIHLYFPDPPADFETRVRLFRDPVYLLNRWWVIIHCLLVLVSMWGFALIQFKKSPGFAGLGFFFIAVFAIAEITRQLIVFFYINELREQYLLSADPITTGSIKSQLTYAGLITAPLFGLFILTFGLGNLSYGISLSGGNRFDKTLSLLLVFWGCCTLINFGNSFWESAGLSRVTEIYGYTFQPLMRTLIGIWLWKKSTTLA